MSGNVNDGVRDHPAGSFIHAPAGSWHISQTVTGCALLVFPARRLMRRVSGRRSGPASPPERRAEPRSEPG
nr:DUF4437 domain-containing protein [Nocardia grenadensis]